MEKKYKRILLGIGADSVGDRLIQAGILPRCTIAATIQLDMNEPVVIQATYFAEGDDAEFVGAFLGDAKEGEEE